MCAARVTLYSLSLPLSCVLCLCRFDFNFLRSLSLRMSQVTYRGQGDTGHNQRHVMKVELVRRRKPKIDIQGAPKVGSSKVRLLSIKKLEPEARGR